ncbi:MAG: DUF4136 domain-containing protein [Ideonella sp.]|nr:DUF4136 domain-containing protein [Ideonella sp.]
MTTTKIEPTRRLALAAAAALAVLLAGCAATRLDASVNTTGNWPAGRAPGSFTYERLPSQMAQKEEQDRLEAEALPALARAGFRPAAAGEAPDVRVQLAARTIQSQAISPAPYYGWPWGGAWGGRWGGAGWGYGGGWGWGAATYLYYEFELAVLIIDARTQQSLYETRARSEGGTPGDGTWAALAAAALKDFPYAAVSPRRVTVELPVK